MDEFPSAAEVAAGARVLLPTADAQCERQGRKCTAHGSVLEHADTQTCRAARQARGTAVSFLTAVEPLIRERMLRSSHDSY